MAMIAAATVGGASSAQIGTSIGSIGRMITATRTIMIITMGIA